MNKRTLATLVTAACSFNVNLMGAAMVVHDPGAIVKLTEQIKTANQVLGKTTSMVKNTDQLMRIAGDPKKMLGSIRDVNDAISQLDKIGNNDTTKSIRNLSRSAAHLQSSKDSLTDAVSGTMLVSGEKQNRNRSLYQGYSVLEEALDEYNSLLKGDQAIQEKEIDRQAELAKELNSATTQAEVDKITVALSASKAIQDASSDKVLKSKDMLETQRLALELEKEKKADAVIEEKDAQMKKAVKYSQKKFQEDKEKIEARIKKRMPVRRYSGLPDVLRKKPKVENENKEVS